MPRGCVHSSRNFRTTHELASAVLSRTFRWRINFGCHNICRGLVAFIGLFSKDYQDRTLVRVGKVVVVCCK